MVNIQSETVYSVDLDDSDLEQLEADSELRFDLPSGDTVRLTYGGTRGLAESSQSAPDEDVSEDEIEELVKEGEKEARSIEGSPVAEEDRSGNGPRGGMIQVERGGGS